MSLDDDAARVLARFGFAGDDVERLERLPQGVKNLNYRVRAGGQDWVLKCHQAAGAAQRLAFSHAFEERVADAGVPVARLRRPTAGGTFVETEAGVFTLHGWVEGRQISIEERDTAHARHPDLAGSLGGLVGDLHRAGRDVPGEDGGRVAGQALLAAPRRTVASIRHGRPRRFRKTARLRWRRQRSDLDSWILASLPELFREAALLSSPHVVGMVDEQDHVLAHNDLNWENLVLDQSGAVLALLDFDNAAALPRALDVGAAAAVLVGADEVRLDGFLAAYSRAYGSDVDRDVVHLGMRWKCVRSMLWSVDAYLSDRVADPEMLLVWCRHLHSCLRALPPLGSGAPVPR